jgi:hypothetical protein
MSIKIHAHNQKKERKVQRCLTTLMAQHLKVVEESLNAKEKKKNNKKWRKWGSWEEGSERLRRVALGCWGENEKNETARVF